MKKQIGSILVFLLTLSIGLLAAEAALRLKNSDQKNYNVEMWRYARLLKMPSLDPMLGHEHRPGSGGVPPSSRLGASVRFCTASDVIYEISFNLPIPRQLCSTERHYQA